MPLTEAQIAIIEATAPVVAEHSLEITRAFYPHMFSENPEVFAYFNRANQKTGKQPRALADALVRYASNIRRLDALGPAVERMVHKHVALKVPPSGYPIVGRHLMWAIHHVLGEAVTDEVHEAWAAAYTQLADILISAEKKMYDEQASAEGGWRGFRSFEVEAVERTASGLMLVKLRPEDGEPVSTFKPGQYVSVHYRPLSVPGMEREQHMAPRHYSIVDGDRSHLQLCVRRVEGGVVSTHMHNTVSVGSHVRISAPIGWFTLQEHPATAPIVFVGGGVGFTPLLPMMRQAKQRGHRVLFVHSVRTEADAELVEHRVEADVHRCVVTSKQPRITGASLVELVRSSCDNVDAVQGGGSPFFYLCAPADMLKSLTEELVREGVAREHIHYEVFGPHLETAASS
eukprot:TRINITY_DN6244_c0_g1_i1.p1 TRINITY_DN6244_c0_g1~~TRINITY_DN6244_c0_g1_i1.p1  ORF type:complete len:424 (+),score=148.26 TRINITY_DN6244_c0_g1_i1:71-1273(+)